MRKASLKPAYNFFMHVIINNFIATLHQNCPISVKPAYKRHHNQTLPAIPSEEKMQPRNPCGAMVFDVFRCGGKVSGKEGTYCVSSRPAGPAYSTKCITLTSKAVRSWAQPSTTLVYTLLWTRPSRARGSPTCMCPVIIATCPQAMQGR